MRDENSITLFKEKCVKKIKLKKISFQENQKQTISFKNLKDYSWSIINLIEYSEFLFIPKIKNLYIIGLGVTVSMGIISVCSTCHILCLSIMIPFHML